MSDTSKFVPVSAAVILAGWLPVITVVGLWSWRERGGFLWEFDFVESSMVVGIN